MNNVRFIVFSFIGMMWGCALSTVPLSAREAAYVAQHCVSDAHRKMLDTIFSGLDQTVLNLFAGKDSKLSKVDLLKLLKRAGFNVYAFHNKPLAHYESDGRSARVIMNHNDFPGFFLKIGFDALRQLKNITRVLYADYINEAIDHLNLTKIGKIEKKLYHRVGRPDELVDFNYVVVVPEIIGYSLKAEKLNREEKRVRNPILFFPTAEYEEQYQTLKTAVGYTDEFRGNFKIANDGKLYIIDTEPGRNKLRALIQEKLGNDE